MTDGCAICGQPKVLHSGLEMFCPMSATYRAPMPDETISERDEMVAVLKSHPREFAAVEAVAAYLRGARSRESMLATLRDVRACAPLPRPDHEGPSHAREGK